ncbi:MAG TPA: hypothetical protein VGH87_05420, partial [Polyangiaceae bacterium]
MSLAVSRNERAKIADLNVVVADAALSRARTAFFPTVLLAGTYTQRPDDTVDPKRASTSFINSSGASLNAAATLN